MLQTKKTKKTTKISPKTSNNTNEISMDYNSLGIKYFVLTIS